MRGTIAIPRGHFEAPWPFVESLVRYLEIPADVWVMFKEGALIEDNRNSLLRLFKGDWIFFLDSDMVFQPWDIAKIVDNPADIVSGLYFKGQSPHEPLAFDQDGKPIRYLSGSIAEVCACAMGFVKINRKVVESLGDNPFRRIGELGEDLSFCKRARDRGFKILCDTSVQPKHLRYRYINEDDYVL